MKKLIALLAALFFTCSAASAQQYFVPPNGQYLPVQPTDGTNSASCTATHMLQVESAKVFSSPSFQEVFISPFIGGSYSCIQGSDGNIYASSYADLKVYKLELPSRRVTAYSLPNSGAPLALCQGSDGYIYGTDYANSCVFQMDTNGNFATFAVPSGHPIDICQGSDGYLYGTEFVTSIVFKMDTAGTFTEFTCPTALADLRGIVEGSDGNLWGVENVGNKVFKMTAAGVFTEYAIPTVGSNSHGICKGNDGNCYVAEQIGKIARVTTAGVITEFASPTPAASVCAGSDGNIYANGTAEIQALQPDGTFVEYPIRVGIDSLAVCQGIDGNLYGIDETMAFFIKSVAQQWTNLAQNNKSLSDSNPLPVTLASGSANQSVNVAQMNGVATATGEGVSSTGTQRVAMARKATYRCTTIQYTVPATPTDMITIAGSASKTIRINKIRMYATQTIAANDRFYLIKRSAADTTGTFVADTGFPIDSGSAVVTATIGHYTANPGGLGAAVGTVDNPIINVVPATAGIQPTYNLYDVSTDQPITLRGTAQNLALNFNGAALPAALTVQLMIEWTEE